MKLKFVDGRKVRNSLELLSMNMKTEQPRSLKYNPQIIGTTARAVRYGKISVDDSESFEGIGRENYKLYSKSKLF